jgi:hypothetical protein
MTLAIAEGVLLQACTDTGLSPAALRQPNRHKLVMRTRQSVVYALRKRTAWSYPQIASFVGLRDHTTALHAVGKITDLMGRDSAILAMIEKLMAAPAIMPFTLNESLRGKIARVPGRPRETTAAKKSRCKPKAELRRPRAAKTRPLTRAEMGFERIEIEGGFGLGWL